jgi:SAM-dependent methyltransferase
MEPTANPDRPAAIYENAGYWESLHAERSDEFSAVGYPELGEGFNRATYELRLQALQRLLKRCGASQMTSLLEGGVGIGAYAPVWGKLQVQRWVGLDISSTAIEKMSKKFPEGEFHKADLCEGAEIDAALGDAQFDLVTAIDILYHIIDDGSFLNALSNLASRVRPTGHFVASDIFCQNECMPARHVKRRSVTTYQSILKPRGFGLIAREQVFAVIGYSEIRLPGVRDKLLSAGWRATAKIVRTCPAGARNLVGTAAVHALKPWDAVLRGMGLGRGSNLELAIFQRTSS